MSMMLESSIQHWQENASATRLDQINIGWRACALCRTYYDEGRCSSRSGNNVTRCPVHAAGHRVCQGTPYYRVRDALSNLDLQEAVKASKDMVTFLEGLRDA